ncbi:MAG TPA: isoprenylcysteine carboxylmethyltransferase family protein [Terriglobales bacterium]|nr:isoprenylcysteine carboxylmethyltransferase family protein [Terriglobales bacterium]
MDRGSILRVWLPLAFGVFAIGAIFRSVPEPRGWMPIAGLAVALFGLAGVIVSRYTLGRSFSVAAKATALVTTGIYSRIRNPIYVSGMFVIGGAILMMRRPAFLAILVIIIPLQIIRARREATVLEATFGDAYREYRKRTWF